MPKEYKEDFQKLYNDKKNHGYNFFEEDEVIVRNKVFKFLVCNMDLDIIKCALKLAKEKSKFTMDQNQASVPRDQVTKLQKCMQGVLAEMFIHFLLIDKYSFTTLRYDLERDSFVYKKDEYDLKIYVNEAYYEIESRSSNVHHDSVKIFIENDVIIGPYGNGIKITDELADFHFRPIYMPDFKPFNLVEGKYRYNTDMLNGKIKLVITGVATKDDFLKHSYLTSLGQYGTTYHVVKAFLVGDITEMDRKFNDLSLK